MIRSQHISVFMATVGIACAVAGAQVRQDTAVRPEGPNAAGGSAPGWMLERVDPGVGDVDPLRASLRDLSVDLRASGDFSAPYRLQGDASADDRFVRFGGGTTAVFPRSVYTSTRRGVVAEVPPGTVFYIGGVPASQPWERTLDGTPPATRWLMAPTMSAQRADVRLNTSARTVVGAEETGASDRPRLAGTRALLRRAAEAPPPPPAKAAQAEPKPSQ
jgi:hypothetical protein